MTDFNKRIAVGFAKHRKRKDFFKYLTEYGWGIHEVEDMWDYAMISKIKAADPAENQGLQNAQ